MSRGYLFAVRSARLGLLCGIAVACLFASQPARAVVTTFSDSSTGSAVNVDGNVSASEYNSYVYTGGGTGFGGTLGTGKFYMESTGTDLYIGADIAGNLGSNIVAIFLDTKAFGFSNDSTLGDFADSGRKVASKLTRDVQDNYPIAADYVLEFGNGFSVVFELKTGSLNPISSTFAGSGGNGAAGGREAKISLASLGISGSGSVKFFGSLISDTQFASNEGIPATGFGGNPGFGAAPVNWPDFHEFVVAVPEASALIALPVASIVGLSLRAFRKRQRA